MKMVKSAFLASAAGIVAMSGAQAADLPVKAKPVEYVKVCSLYGAGFYYIPGTDICMKVGGYIRWQESFNPGNNISGGPFNGTGGRDTRIDSQDFAQRSRAIATFDTRQQTAYGTLRTYLLLGYSQDSTVAPSTAPAVYMTRGFIQIAGFTFGKATSFFDFVSTAAVAYNAGMLHAPDTGDAGQLVAAYTAQFGNGVSASISAEQTRRLATVQIGQAYYNTFTFVENSYTNQYLTVGTLPGNPVNDLSGLQLASVGQQDIVANLRIDQAWGSAQISGAVHEVSAGYYGGTRNLNTAAAITAPGQSVTGLFEDGGHPGNKWGWAASAGLRLNAPMIGPGDYFQVAGVYAQGATKYTGGATPTSNSYVRFQGSNVGFGFWEDAVFGGACSSTANGPASTTSGGACTGVNGEIQLTTSWAIMGSYEHFWTPSLRTSVYGSYVKIEHNAEAKALICNSNSLGRGSNASTNSPSGQITNTLFNGNQAGCDPDFSAWNVGTRSQWNITKDLYVGLDVIYLKLNSAKANDTGVVRLQGAGGKPPSLYTVSDQDAWVATWRIHRDIVP